MQIQKALTNRVVISYILDYVIVIFLIVAFSALDKAEPHHQLFSVNNISLQYPMAIPERVTPVLAGVVSCAFPLLVIIVWTMLLDGFYSHSKEKRKQKKKYTLNDRLWQMNCGILGLGLSVAAAITITGALKNLTGKPRPDIIDRCKLPDGYEQKLYQLTSYDMCTGDKHVLKDGFKSWPSGHSSIAFAGLGYLSFYLAGKLHILDNRGEVWKTVLVLVPVISAAMIAVSRIMDARHHPFDVLSSSLLGILVAWIAYRQYFPALSNVDAKGRAHSMRSWGKTKAENKTRVDEEQGKITDSYENDRGMASGAGNGSSSNSMERRQYLEASERIEFGRQEAHGFRGAIIGQGQSQAPASSQSPPPPQRTDSGPYGTSSTGGEYEMTSTTKGPRGGYSVTTTPVDSRGFSPPGRNNTASTVTSVGLSPDRLSGIHLATSSISNDIPTYPDPSTGRKGSIGGGFSPEKDRMMSPSSRKGTGF